MLFRHGRHGLFTVGSGGDSHLANSGDREKQAMRDDLSARNTQREGIDDDLRTVYGTVQQISVPRWLKLDLTMAQFKALVAIHRNLGISVCSLGRELSIGESTASVLVDQLVRRGQVERTTDPDDRRRVRLAATARGEKLLSELRQGNREIMANWLAELGDDELDAQVVSASTLRSASDLTTKKVNA
jgi:DNA-binding MarR family transcriptional regulator